MFKLPFIQSKGLPDEGKRQKQERILPVQKYKDSCAFRCWFRFSVMAASIIRPKPPFHFQCDLKNEKAAIRAARETSFRKALRIAESKIFLSCYRDSAFLKMSKLAASSGNRLFASTFSEKIQDISTKDKSYEGVAIAFAESGRISFALDAAKNIFRDELRMETYGQIYLSACKMKNLASQGTDTAAWKIALDMAHKGPIHHHQCAHDVISLIKDSFLRTDALKMIEAKQSYVFNKKGGPNASSP